MNFGGSQIMNHLKPFNFTIMFFIAVIVMITPLYGVTLQSHTDNNLTKANELFHNGQFDEAGQLFKKLLENDPDSYDAVIGMSRIFVLCNKLDKAETFIKKAIKLKPGEKEPQMLMGEILYRQDRYFEAAQYFEAAGQKAKAEKMRAFKGKTPFLIEKGPNISIVPFIRTDPLPTIEITVNGQKGIFLIDTGALDLHINPNFAEKCGIKPLGETQIGTFAGGRQAALNSGVANSVQLGDFSILNVPVTLPEKGQGLFGVDGIIGTAALYHFKFTLDYPGGKLILQRYPADASSKSLAESDLEGYIQIPFWMVGDHFIIARGTANGAGPYLFIVDTGMAGAGFSCQKYLIDEAKIEVSKQGFQGMGGGGPITIYPFMVNLSLGDAHNDNVRGFFGAMPFDSENRFGFRTGGIISHGFFRPFSVTFDFQNMNMYLKKA